MAAVDDRVNTAEDEDIQRAMRKCHRKVAQFLCRPDLQVIILSTLAVSHCTEQLQINLCCWDSARKQLAKARSAQRVERACRRQGRHTYAGVNEEVAHVSASLLDHLDGAMDLQSDRLSDRLPDHMGNPSNPLILLDMLEGVVVVVLR